MNFHYHQRKNLATSTKTFNDSNEKVCIDAVPIKKVEVFNFLGVEIQSSLQWDAHITKISSKVGKGLGILTKLKHFLPKKVLIMIYNTLIQSHLNYGILTWGFKPGKLAVQQKKAIRAISLAKYNSHTEKACKDLKILRIEEMFELRCLKFLYNIQNNAVPVYFSNNFLDGASTTRTSGASQCLHFHLRNVITRNPQNIL